MWSLFQQIPLQVWPCVSKTNVGYYRCSLFVSLFCGLAALVLVPLIKKRWRPAIFCPERIGKNVGEVLISSGLCTPDAEERKRFVGAECDGWRYV